MNLSKSKYTRGFQCHKMLWLDINKPEVAKVIDNEAVFETGHEVGELAKNLFGKYTDIEFNKDLNQMIKDTDAAIKRGDKIITEASFVYENNFCSVDILVNNNNELEVYEVKSSTDLHDIYKEDISYQVYILLSLGYKVKKASIVYLNKNYVFHDKLDIKKLFVIDDITKYVLNNQESIKENIEEIIKDCSKDEPDINIGYQCNNPYECPYFDYCTKDLIRPNIFDIRILPFKSKIKNYNNSIISYEDILKSDLNEKYIEQAEYEIKDLKPKIEKDLIKDFLTTITYPIYFLDFETYQEAIPKYEGTKPFEQIPFQYSLHILYEDGKLVHKEFLAEPDIDPRLSLAKRLVEDIPKDVCSVAYNMSFEKNVIKKLAEVYPDLREHLLNIRENMKDLMIPFYKRWYYMKEMEGSYSIKYVLPALFPDDPSLNYKNLPLVHKGDEASSTYKDLGNHTKEEQETIRHGLLVYCELDTFAMVKIYEKLIEIIK